MRARILAVCPYEALQELILDVARSRDDLEVTPLTGDISEGRQKLVERVQPIQSDYDILTVSYTHLVPIPGTSGISRHPFSIFSGVA